MNDGWATPDDVEPENPLLAMKAAEAAPEPDFEVLSIRASQEAFEKVMDGLIAFYRDFDRTRRTAMKEKLKALREELVALGATIGISRISLDNLWQG